MNIWKKIVGFMTIMPTAEKPLVLKDEIDLKNLTKKQKKN
tara:strand:+ start:262 stop:381 length:120 start_codon:yes stop_codon:yes gene_type:complete